MALVQIPGLGLFKGSAGSSTDVVVGALGGLVGIGAIKFVVNKYLRAQMPALVLRGLPFLSSAVAAAALYYTGRKGGAGKGRAIGALMVGAAINVWDEVRANVPDLADLVSVRLDGYGRAHMGGMLIDNPRYNGMIIDNPGARLDGLNAINMAPDDDE